jgi:hypothetical protein
MSSLGTFIGVSLVLGLGLSIILAYAFKSSVLASWDESRCKPGVIAMASLFKPDSDTRTGAEFASENWAFCQKQYIELAIRTATTEVKNLADSQGDIVNIANGVVSGLAKTFTGLWGMCYQAFSIIMDRFNSAAKLMRNMMINMYAIVDRLQSVMFSVAMGLISAVSAMINTVTVTLMVATIIIGIILVLQIVLFYIFAPISGLIVTISAMVLATAVIVTTAITAAAISNACFIGDTRVITKNGPRPIRDIRVGDILEDGAQVTATHRFTRTGTLYDLYGIHVSGSHLVWLTGGLISVKHAPDAVNSSVMDTEVYCLTTSNRKIPVLGMRRVVFADWEEIPESDAGALEAWYKKVYMTLNESTPSSTPDLSHEAGFSPETLVTLEAGQKVPAYSITLGDRLIDGTVLGIVHQESSDTILIDGVWISVGCWVFDSMKQTWDICGSKAVIRQPLIHFYTTSGVVTLNGIKIRDASEVGLDVIGNLVNEIVCPG